MKQCEQVVDRLLTLAEQVDQDKRNINHLKAEADILVQATNAAYRHSQHMHLQKQKPVVKFFDLEVKPKRISK